MGIRRSSFTAGAAMFILSSFLVSPSSSWASPTSDGPQKSSGTFASSTHLNAGTLVRKGSSTSLAPAKAAGKRFVTYSSSTPIAAGAKISVKALPVRAQQSLATSSSNDDLVTPATVTSVPHGYRLRGNRRLGYVYTSDNVYLIDEECDEVLCSVLQDVRVTAKQQLVAGSSRDWNITFFSTDDSGPGGPGQVYDFYGGYGCGFRPVGGGGLLNCYGEIPKASAGFGPEPFPVNKSNVSRSSFGTVNGITVFPYQHFYVTFASGHHFHDNGSGADGQEGIKFRDWDTCTSASNNKFCGVTGTTT